MQQLLELGQIPSPTLADPDPPPNCADATASSATQALPSYKASSMYDFVKVKVWLGQNADHYYVLSRFLLSRMLSVTKIPNHVAIKIALELKKLLVDNSLLDSDLEANPFEKCGYGEDYINRYKMMTRFHHQRVPLVILVCGTVCTGKSTIATQLAQRFNLPNVLQLITEFCRECRVVRKGLAGDLKKAMKDGKPIMIEGIHLDPSIYLMDEEKRDDNSRTGKTIPDSENSSISNRISPTMENENFVKSKDCTLEEGRISEGVSYAESHETSTVLCLVPGDGNKDLGQPKNNTPKKDKPAAEMIVVPIVLSMSDFDQKALLEEWIATGAFRDSFHPQDRRELINNLKLIQDYICSFESQGLTIVDISANSFPQTLDLLHSYLLKCIERGLLAACSESCNQGKN
ncbi:hypothetical protein PVAP13_3KG385581 [Panicum virgatum]|uniref:P-loop containing nucleoside triphosphate hydrolases superfamily protein n=1 Tax=Panicum virgatum TaxID=38727 RepID=A0A8T0V208_PANVG|nr:hypothetical protein PVAP13_3KG385581 [Panicum virgatum]